MLSVSTKATSPNRLRVLRAEHRLTQGAVASAAGITQWRYWNIEQGREPTPEERKALADVFGIPASQIFANGRR